MLTVKPSWLDKKYMKLLLFLEEHGIISEDHSDSLFHNILYKHTRGIDISGMRIVPHSQSGCLILVPGELPLGEIQRFSEEINKYDSEPEEGWEGLRERIRKVPGIV